jgi:hypothetical protein
LKVLLTDVTRPFKKVVKELTLSNGREIRYIYRLFD